MILVLILLIATQCSGAEVPEDAADLAVDQVVPEEDQVEEGAASDVEVEEDVPVEVDVEVELDVNVELWMKMEVMLISKL